MSGRFTLRGGSSGGGKLSALLDELTRAVNEARERASAAALQHFRVGDLEWIERDRPIEKLGDRTTTLELCVLEAGSPVPIWQVELRWQGSTCTVRETWIRPEYSRAPTEA